jgi:uncharacterized protein YcfJ
LAPIVHGDIGSMSINSGYAMMYAAAPLCSLFYLNQIRTDKSTLKMLSKGTKTSFPAARKPCGFSFLRRSEMLFGGEGHYRPSLLLRIVTTAYVRNSRLTAVSHAASLLWVYQQPHLRRQPNMANTSTTQRIHPLVAGAAGSVMLVSLLGAAAITGILPSSHSSGTPSVATPVVAAPVAAASAPVATVPQVAQPVAAAQPAPKVVEKTIVHHRYVTHTKPVQIAQNAPAPAPVYAPAQPKQPVSQVSPIGIGVGAVVGGVLGSKVGGGNGKTLATIAGAVGGGYVGNEIAKRY